VAAGTVFPYDVGLRDEPEQTLLVVEGSTTADLHVVYGHALVAELMARLERLGLPLDQPVVCVMPRTDDDTLFLQMGVPIANPPADEHTIALPAGPAAVARHVGPYEEAGLADLAVHAWVEERGYEVAGPLRERYLNDPAVVPREALVTEVIVPVKMTGTRGTASDRR
jgi:effector-binding domain-containing protein